MFYPRNNSFRDAVLLLKSKGTIEEINSIIGNQFGSSISIIFPYNERDVTKLYFILDTHQHDILPHVEIRIKKIIGYDYIKVIMKSSLMHTGQSDIFAISQVISSENQQNIEKFINKHYSYFISNMMPDNQNDRVIHGSARQNNTLTYNLITSCKRIYKVIKSIIIHSYFDKRSSKQLALFTLIVTSISVMLNLYTPHIFHKIVSQLSPNVAGSAVINFSSDLILSYVIFWSTKHIARLARNGALFAQSMHTAKNISINIADIIMHSRMIQAQAHSQQQITNSAEKVYEAVDMIVQRGTVNFIQNIIEMVTIAGYLSIKYGSVYLFGMFFITASYLYYTAKSMPHMFTKRNKFIDTQKLTREQLFDYLTNSDGFRFQGNTESSVYAFSNALSLRNKAYEEYAKTSVLVQSGQIAIVALGIGLLIQQTIIQKNNHSFIEVIKIVNLLLQWGELFDNLGTTMAQFDTSFRTLNELIDISENIQTIKQNYSTNYNQANIGYIHSINFENVYLSHNHQNIVSEISIKLERNITALIGRSGMGKTTIAKLILRLDDPTTGKICINDVDLKKFNTDVWIRNITYLTQGKDTKLFKNTLKFNITLFENYTDEMQLKEVIKQAGLTTLVSKLPHGLETIIGAGSTTNLSGGERKLIALARFLMKNDAQVCILDEPTSDLDPSTAKETIEKLRLFCERRITLIITHDLELAQELADQIIIIDNGKVIGQGSHGNLAKKCEHYRNMLDDFASKMHNPENQSIFRRTHESNLSATELPFFNRHRTNINTQNSNENRDKSPRKSM